MRKTTAQMTTIALAVFLLAAPDPSHAAGEEDLPGVGKAYSCDVNTGICSCHGKVACERMKADSMRICKPTFWECRNGGCTCYSKSPDAHGDSSADRTPPRMPHSVPSPERVPNVDRASRNIRHDAGIPVMPRGLTPKQQQIFAGCLKRGGSRAQCEKIATSGAIKPGVSADDA